MRSMTLLLILLLIAACDGRGDDPASSAMTMRVYDVPADRAAALRDSLNEALGTVDEKNGKVSVGADGKLVVLAPERLHLSIETSLKQLAVDSSAAPKSDATSLRLRMWTVDSIPEPGEDSAGLADVQAALDALRAASPGLRFRLRDRIESVSMSGEQVHRDWLGYSRDYMQGSQNMDYQLTLEADGHVRVFVHLNDNLQPRSFAGRENAPGAPTPGSQLRTTARMAAGQLLVLATQPIDNPSTGQLSTRYYIIRVDAVGAD